MDYYSSYKKVNTPRTADPDTLQRINKLKDEYNVSPNALSFLSSLLVGYKKYGGITKKQYDAFCEIENNYLHANSDLDATWFENYDDMKRETTKICALYYCANPPYYGDLAYRALYDKDFIPSEKQYKTLTQNKYAQKVLESHFSKSKFKVNDYVSLRKNNPCDIPNNKNIFIVIQVASEPITTAAKNTKKYKILPLDTTTTYNVEERWLKFAIKK
tara:strand:+ start:682 stop:1329 length:648 start_codon:yes stop_codon:yes gene_type:complete